MATSTWGATFRHVRQVYNLVVRLVVYFGANRCLRTVAGAYKATPIKALEVETHTLLIYIYLDRLVVGACLRL